MKKLAMGLIFIIFTNLFANIFVKGETNIIEITDHNTIFVYNQQKKDSIPIIDVNVEITMPLGVLDGYLSIKIRQIYPEKTDWTSPIVNQQISIKKPKYEFWRAQDDFYAPIRVEKIGIYQIQSTLLLEKEEDGEIKKYIFYSNIQDFFVNERVPYFLETPQETKSIVAIENMMSIQRTDNVLFRIKLKPQDINFENTFFYIDVYNNTLPLLSYKLGQIKNSFNYKDFSFDWVAPKELFLGNYQIPLTFKVRTQEHDQPSPVILYGENLGIVNIAPNN